MLLPVVQAVAAAEEEGLPLAPGTLFSSGPWNRTLLTDLAALEAARGQSQAGFECNWLACDSMSSKVKSAAWLDTLAEAPLVGQYFRSLHKWMLRYVRSLGSKKERGENSRRGAGHGCFGLPSSWLAPHLLWQP